MRFLFLSLDTPPMIMKLYDSSLHFSVYLQWAKLLLKSIHLNLLSFWCQIWSLS